MIETRSILICPIGLQLKIMDDKTLFFYLWQEMKGDHPLLLLRVLNR